MAKWKEQIKSEYILEKVAATRFIGVFKVARPIDGFDADLFFKLVEKIVIYENRVRVVLLNENEINREYGYLY